MVNISKYIAFGEEGIISPTVEIMGRDTYRDFGQGSECLFETSWVSDVGRHRDKKCFWDGGKFLPGFV